MDWKKVQKCFPKTQNKRTEIDSRREIIKYRINPGHSIVLSEKRGNKESEIKRNN